MVKNYSNKQLHYHTSICFHVEALAIKEKSISTGTVIVNLH